MISKLFGVLAVFLLLASVNGKFPEIYFNNFNLFCLNTFYLEKLLSEETLSERSWSQESVIFNDMKKKTLKLKEIWWLLLKFIWIFIWIFFFFKFILDFLKNIWTALCRVNTFSRPGVIFCEYHLLEYWIYLWQYYS